MPAIYLQSGGTAMDEARHLIRSDDLPPNKSEGALHIIRGGVQMNETKTTKRYVDDNLLGEGVLFRSCIGQRMGLANTKIASYVNLGKDRLRIGVMPQRYQGRKEII